MGAANMSTNVQCEELTGEHRRLYARDKLGEGVVVA